MDLPQHGANEARHLPGLRFHGGKPGRQRLLAAMP
jgi:hypothetical protein